MLLLFHRRPCSTYVDVDGVYRLQGRVHVNVVNKHMLTGRLCVSPQRNNSVLGGPWSMVHPILTCYFGFWFSIFFLSVVGVHQL